jgi:hypothetical protein
MRSEQPGLREALWPDPNALASALFTGYDYTVTPDAIREAYAALAASPSPEPEGK